MEAGSKVDATMDKMEQQLELWGAKLKEAMAKLDVAGKQAKIDARRELDELKVKLDKARAKLADAKAASADNLDTLKQGAERAWKELEGAFKKMTH